MDFYGQNHGFAEANCRLMLHEALRMNCHADVMGCYISTRSRRKDDANMWDNLNIEFCACRHEGVDND